MCVWCLLSDDTVSGQSVSSLVERASSFEENQRTGENDEVLDENEISEGDQEMLPESDQLKEQTESLFINLINKRASKNIVMIIKQNYVLDV